MKDLGNKIYSLRKKKGLTLKQLGEMINRSESFMSYIEKGERKLEVEDLKKIADIFEVDYQYLLGKPKIVTSQFRSDKNIDDNIDYGKVMRDFAKYARDN